MHDARVDVGTLNIKAEKFTGNATTNTGDMKIEGNVGDSCKFVTNVGDLTVKGNVGAGASMKTNVGDIKCKK